MEYKDIYVTIHIGHLLVTGVRGGVGFKTTRPYHQAADVVERVKLIHKATGVWAGVRLGQDAQAAGWDEFLVRVQSMLNKYRLIRHGNEQLVLPHIHN